MIQANVGIKYKGVSNCIVYAPNSDRFFYSKRGNGSYTTGVYFQTLGSIHDIESSFSTGNVVSLTTQVFSSHWGHLSVIFFWISGVLFHIGWSGNYMGWLANPVSVLPISHLVFDPHFSSLSMDTYCSFGLDSAVNICYSGVYHWLYAAGFTSVRQLYWCVIFTECVAVVALILGSIHVTYLEALILWCTSSLSSSVLLRPPLRLIIACYDASGLRLNFHTGIMMGVSSIAWSGHLVHVVVSPHHSKDISLYPLYTGHWSAYSTSSLLTFFGGFNAETQSLYGTDIVHHHLALGVLLVWSGHVYFSLSKGYAHRIRDMVFVNGNVSCLMLHLSKSLNLQLSLALAGLCVVLSIVSQDTYSLNSYPYLSYDWVTSVALYVHHSFIASLLMIGAFAHAAIFLIRDYTLDASSFLDIVPLVLTHRSAVISHLSWVCLWLGFHTLGLYIHNDTVVAFGESQKQLLVEPLFSASVQGAYASFYGGDLLSFPVLVPLSPGDLYAHHAIALGLHVTTLILLKGALDGRGSKLMPDKVQFGYGFSCDGPGRGGTCDISGWDAFYLASFWMLNTVAWLSFYFHWKHLTLGSPSVFVESSTYLTGWFRDYLWFNSSSLIRGYDSLTSNDLSVWAWLFLAAHLCWATGFMFLISWRGYWQELIEIIVYAHLKTPMMYTLWVGKGFTPVALSIVQARFIGLVHFIVGFILTYASFVIGSTL